jgi:hypothetical protein
MQTAAGFYGAQCSADFDDAPSFRSFLCVRLYAQATLPLFYLIAYKRGKLEKEADMEASPKIKPRVKRIFF